MTLPCKPFCDQSNYYCNYCNFIHEQRNTVILLTDFLNFFVICEEDIIFWNVMEQQRKVGIENLLCKICTITWTSIRETIVVVVLRASAM